MENIYKIVGGIGSFLAIITALIGIAKFYLDTTLNKKKQSKEDYEALLLVIKNSDENDENRKNFVKLAEEKKYEFIIGIPFINLRCAQYLLGHVDRTKKIYQYRRSSNLVVFLETTNEFIYAFGFKNRWIRKIKKWGAFTLYLIFFLLAAVPVFFGKFIDPDLKLYNNFIKNSSIESFWLTLLIWIVIFLYLAFSTINYAAKIHFAEKLVIDSSKK